MLTNISFKKMILTTVFFLASGVVHAATPAMSPVADIATGEGVGLAGHPQSKSNVCLCNLTPAPIVAGAGYDQLLGTAADAGKTPEGSN
jgi:hypothetical protein